MDECECPPSRGIVKTEFAGFRLVLLVLLGLVAAALWAWAAWEAYVQVPKTLKVLAEFGLQVSPLPHAVLEQAGLALPVLASIGLIGAWWTRSRWAWRVVLLGMPLSAAVTLYVIKYHYLSKLLKGLAPEGM